MYTAEQIKPKRYPENKPAENGWYWAYPDHLGEWGAYTYPANYPWNSRPIVWFIDIPGAPEELKPLAYPYQKPSERGQYIVHNRIYDMWYPLGWLMDGSIGWNENIDWFIPIRLNEQESEEKVKVLFIRDKDLKTMDDLCDYLKKIHGKRYLIELAEKIAEHEGYTVTRKEQEIAPCPVCGGQNLDVISAGDGTLARVICYDCQIGTNDGQSDLVIETWNSLPRKAD